MTYQLTVLPEFSGLTESYRIFVDFLDTDKRVMFTDHHTPPVATTEWQPGQTVSYRRRMFIPIYPYVGDALITLRLASPSTGDPVALVRRTPRPRTLSGGDRRVGAISAEYSDVPGRLAPARAGR